MVDAIVLNRSPLQQGHRVADTFFVLRVDQAAVDCPQGSDSTALPRADAPLQRQDVQFALTGGGEDAVFLHILEDGDVTGLRYLGGAYVTKLRWRDAHVGRHHRPSGGSPYCSDRRVDVGQNFIWSLLRP